MGANTIYFTYPRLNNIKEKEQIIGKAL